MDQWRAWLRLWRSRVDTFRSLMARRAVASALRHWRLESFAANDRRHRLQALVGRQLEVILLRKCFLTLAQNAHSVMTLRRLIASFRVRALGGGFEAWRQAALREEQKSRTPPSPATVVNVITERRRQPGNPRKLHCRCVYAVSRGQRCTCAPRSHLLRRVEELHRLVAQGLDGRQGGYRLLSHVVQRAVPAPSDVGTHLRELNPSSSFGNSGRGCNGSARTSGVTVRARGGRDKRPKERARSGSGSFRKRSLERELPVGTESAASSAAGTAAVATTSFNAAKEGHVRLGAHRTHSMDGGVDAISCVASVASDGLRCDPAVRPPFHYFLLQT